MALATSRLFSGESTSPQSGRFSDSRAARAEELRCRGGLDLALFERPARAHFAVRHVHNGEGNPGISQKEGDAAGAPFHIVGVGAKEEDVDVTHCGHKQPWYL